jgi:hypothetical protein
MAKPIDESHGRLAGPRRPTADAPANKPVMGVVPPEPTSADEAGEIDYTHGDATRVREELGGSAPSEGEQAADEAKRRELYRRGASNVSKG